MDGCFRKAYPTDLTDQQWSLIESILLAYFCCVPCLE